MDKIKVTLKKSTIGLVENQKANVAALGLKKIGQSKIHNDTPHIRGMIKKVSFLLNVEKIS
ncbi:MAG: 50S ribosomal protein L30 [Clostridiales bacterium]|jgi:large subunit ribosomal protein L30|nr:50S ribosomal protein L30 [Clostridiales bacterium]